jgi:hypothetical protein
MVYMMRTEKNMTEFEKVAYGMSEAEMRDRYGNYAKVVGVEMFVAGLLRDCQAMVANPAKGDDERIRKTLNMAKFFLFENMKEEA